VAAGWSVMDALNKSSRAAAEEKPKARFRTKDISIKKLYCNERNFYTMPDIKELAQQILAVGMIENLTVMYAPCEAGEYRIIAGERRWRALNFLLECGHEEFEMATCQIRTPAEGHEETVQLIIANAYRSKTVMDILEEEKRLKESLQYMKENGLTLQGYKLDSGRLRDVIAEIMNLRRTKVAQIEAINKNLLPEVLQELREGRLTFSAAYEISGMPEDAQRQMLERSRESGLTWKEVREAKQAADPVEETPLEVEESENEAVEPEAEATQASAEEGSRQQALGEPEEEARQQAHPESITSLCWSCKRYADCNVKTSTCTDCDRYISKAEAEKTEAQRYSEEQDAIDRETKKKLREMEQEEKMSHLPSDTRQHPMIHEIKLGAQFFDDALSGRKDFELRKNDCDYRVGDTMELVEHRDGQETGRRCRKEIIYILEDYTGLEDGFCILGCKKESVPPVVNTDLEMKEAEKILKKEQPPLPFLKNDIQRKEWLGNYKSWGLWYRDENIGADFYKYDFENGARLIAEVYQREETKYYDAYEACYLHLVGGPEPPRGSSGAGKWIRHSRYDKCPNSETELVEFLKELQKKR
jgi:ParB family chromosome partitioning protein